MKYLGRILLALSATLLLLAACATTLGTEAASPVEVRPLVLKIGYDPAFLRVDVRRATHIEMQMAPGPASQSASSGSKPGSGGLAAAGSGSSSNQLEEIHVPNPYHYLTVYLGNGLILDYQGNLSVDLLKLYHLNTAQDYTIVKRFNSFLPAGSEITKQGNEFTRKGVGLSGGKLSWSRSGKVVSLVGDIFHRHMKILFAKGSVTYEPSGRPGINAITLRRPSPNEVILPEWGGNRVIRLESPNHLVGNRGLEIVRHPNRLEILFHGPFGIDASYTFRRTADGCTFSGFPSGTTITVARSGNVIRIFRNGHLDSTVTIDSLTARPHRR